MGYRTPTIVERLYAPSRTGRSCRCAESANSFLIGISATVMEGAVIEENNVVPHEQLRGRLSG